MNPVEQQRHRTALQQLESDVEAIIDDLRKQIDDERMRRIKAEDDQRASVDREVRMLRDGDIYLRSAQESLAAMCEEASEPIRRGFWGRLQWLVLGR